ncbi:MAG: ATP-grasp domain-containing protein [Oscillospiraceae bacterium]|jgi:biotin carboxylase|nr:ATP-grasp domain-containing protein [Oscillospiraceae bacterium]
MKKVLILNAGHNDERSIKALKEMNYYIISSGNRPYLPGHKMCDEYHPVDYSDMEAVLELAKALEIDRICNCCSDAGIITASYVAEKLGLPGYDSYETTLLLHNKDLFKKFAEKHGIDTPAAKQFLSADEAKEYAASAKYPIIVKAVDLSGGNGIRKAENPDEAASAIDNAFERSKVKHIVIEPYIVGSQHGFCSYLIDKKVVGYCSNNEYSIVNPYRVEIDTFPASDEAVVAGRIIAQIEKMAEALDLCDGTFHLQYITDADDRPHIIECMRRIPGGLYTVPGESVSGINWDYWDARARCGESLADFPMFRHHNRGFFSYKCVMAPENGTIKNIVISPEIKKHRYGEWWLLHEGDKVEDYLSTPISYIFTAYGSQEEMRRILVDEYSDSRVEMIPGEG